jgi:hypothetical protein
MKNKVLIVTKESKYEYERAKFNLSHDEILRKYSGEKANVEAILKSHDAQVASRQELRKLLPDSPVISLSSPDLRNIVNRYDTVIAFGGDNSFSYVSHFLDSIPIMGINSDPSRSVGALCAWDARRLDETIRSLQEGKFEIEEWTRLTAQLNGTTLSPATSEYFFGEDRRKDMSRHLMVYRGTEIETKGSGVIVSTGAGSTGWYDSAIRFLHPNGKNFLKTEEKAAFVVTEPYRFRADPRHVYEGEILPDEEIVLHSLNDGSGYATSDCWEEYDFFRGKRAAVKISEEPLRVITPKK